MAILLSGSCSLTRPEEPRVLPAGEELCERRGAVGVYLKPLLPDRNLCGVMRSLERIPQSAVLVLRRPSPLLCKWNTLKSKTVPTAKTTSRCVFWAVVWLLGQSDGAEAVQDAETCVFSPKRRATPAEPSQSVEPLSWPGPVSLTCSRAEHQTVKTHILIYSDIREVIYMQRTWDDLCSRSSVGGAGTAGVSMETGWAHPGLVLCWQ